MTRRKLSLLLVAIAATVAVPVATAFSSASPPPVPVRDSAAQVVPGSTFTYQGRLTENGAPANGVYDLRFILYSAESGGSQVGAITETKDNVTVANGLFTVTLNFGLGVFDGSPRWLEIAVRPGASSGDFTVLSPRQRITPTPYAFHAAMAEALEVPWSGVGSTGTGIAIVSVTQNGDGYAILANRSEEAEGTDAAIRGLNAGNGAGVAGHSTNASGAGVQGTTASASGTGGRFSGAGPSSRALQIADGAIEVTGNTRPAFVHQVENANRCGGAEPADGTIIDHPLANNTPNALLFVTPVGSDLAGVPVSVAYSPGNCVGGNNRWVILADTALGDGWEFNVLIIRDDNTS
jgi:hypothetical protein